MKTLTLQQVARYFQVTLATFKTKTNKFIWLDCHQGFLKPRMQITQNYEDKKNVRFFFAPLEPFDQNEEQLMKAMNVSALRQLQWATKVLRHLVMKFDFGASWSHFPPFLPKQC